MENPQTRAEWAQQMADTVHRKMLAEEQQHQRGSLTQSQAEHVWVTGMDKVVSTLTSLVQALRDTGHFPHLKLVTNAHSPQGTTTYMRRGSLLSLKGLQGKTPTIEFEIDGAPPFRADVLTPIVRVVTIANSLHPANRRKAHGCFGVSVQIGLAWVVPGPTLLGLVSTPDTSSPTAKAARPAGARGKAGSVPSHSLSVSGEREYATCFPS